MWKQMFDILGLQWRLLGWWCVVAPDRVSMALDVDGKLPDLTPHMELQAYGRQQRGIMEAICSGGTRPTSRPWAPRQRSTTTRFLQTKDLGQEKSSCKKTVTMAPRSRYLTSQSQYCIRKPLFVTECHVSILKKPGLPEQSEQVRWHVENRLLLWIRLDGKCSAAVSVS